MLIETSFEGSHNSGDVYYLARACEFPPTPLRYVRRAHSEFWLSYEEGQVRIWLHDREVAVIDSEFIGVRDVAPALL
jgi:hypothetical protein